MSPDISVGIETAIELDGWGLILGRGVNLSAIHTVQTSSGAHTASHAVGTRANFHCR
jgi:hypothetical protein